MTEQEYRDLDRRISECLGWKDIQDEAYTPSGRAMCGTPPKDSRYYPGPWANGRAYVPRYTTNPAATAEVKRWLRSQGWSIGITIESGQESEHPGVFVCLTRGWEEDKAQEKFRAVAGFCDYATEEVTEGVAVCLAAIAAVEAAQKPVEAPGKAEEAKP